MDSREAYKVIQQLRATKGTNAKKIILENNPGLQPYLRAAYNPYQHFNVSPPATGGFGNSVMTENESYALLNRLSMGKLSGNAARKELREHCEALDYNSYQVFCCILKKSFDIGLAEKGINDVFPGLIPVHAIQLAKPVDWKRVTFPCYIQPKLDGLRAIYREGKFYSRKGHELQGLAKLAEQCKIMFNNQALDGELMVPGVHFNEISGKIRSFDETPDAVYHVFDLPDHDGVYCERLRALRMCARAYGNQPQVVVVLANRIEDRAEAEFNYANFRKKGYEGAMLKMPDSKYENSRTWAWQKMKNTSTADCVVTNIFEGQGKYQGLVGGVYIDFNGVQVGVGSGLTDSQRHAWMDAPEEIIGKAVEVAYQEVTPDGSLRHPRLVTVRGDL